MNPARITFIRKRSSARLHCRKRSEKLCWPRSPTLWRRTQSRRAGRAARPIGQCRNGGLGWLEVEYVSCKTRASLTLDAIRRPRDMPLCKLEASLKCCSFRKGRYAPPVHMIKLTDEITPYQWVHPDQER